MQEEGLIERKVALLNPKLLGFSITVFVNVKLPKADSSLKVRSQPFYRPESKS